MRIKCLFISILITFFSVGCASNIDILKNPNSIFPIEPVGNTPAFLFPVSFHIPGDSDQIGIACSDAVASEFGLSVFSGQSVKGIVGDLSFTLGEGIRKQVQNGKFSMNDGNKEIAEELETVLELVVDDLKALGVVEPDFRFNHIIVLHTDFVDGDLPGFAKFVMFGGIYEIETREILSFIESEETILDITETMISTISPQFIDMVKMLFSGKVGKRRNR